MNEDVSVKEWMTENRIRKGWSTNIGLCRRKIGGLIKNGEG